MKLPVLLVFSLICTAWYGCCNGNINYAYVRINDTTLSSFMPYSGSDSLYFLYNGTDTQLFVGQGIKRTQQRVKLDQHCEGYYMLDHLSCVFRNVNKPGGAVEIAFFYKHLGHATPQVRFYASVKWLHVTYEEDMLTDPDWLPYLHHNDSVYVNKKFYWYIKRYWNPGNSTPNPVYYNYDVGLIKLIVGKNSLERIEH